jgi:membrane protein implicated in regulation of membrane protease activity
VGFLKGLGLFILCYLAASIIAGVGITILFGIDNTSVSGFLTLIVTLVLFFYSRYEMKKRKDKKLSA